jgi:hypothetical protein
VTTPEPGGHEVDARDQHLGQQRQLAAEVVEHPGEVGTMKISITVDSRIAMMNTMTG